MTRKQIIDTDYVEEDSTHSKGSSTTSPKSSSPVLPAQKRRKLTTLKKPIMQSKESDFSQNIPSSSNLQLSIPVKVKNQDRSKSRELKPPIRPIPLNVPSSMAQSFLSHLNVDNSSDRTYSSSSGYQFPVLTASSRSPNVPVSPIVARNNGFTSSLNTDSAQYVPGGLQINPSSREHSNQFYQSDQSNPSLQNPETSYNNYNFDSSSSSQYQSIPMPSDSYYRYQSQPSDYTSTYYGTQQSHYPNYPNQYHYLPRSENNSYDYNQNIASYQNNQQPFNSQQTGDYLPTFSHSYPPPSSSLASQSRQSMYEYESVASYRNGPNISAAPAEAQQEDGISLAALEKR